MTPAHRDLIRMLVEQILAEAPAEDLEIESGIVASPQPDRSNPLLESPHAGQILALARR